MRVPSPPLASLLTLTALWLGACGPAGGTYCQSGPKYGTTCYSSTEVTGQPGMYEAPDHTDGGQEAAGPP
ncbi:MAG TPA: hypothetical protein PLU22_04340 [Polyangiaceae bacterium]|nr:hypothetical protein [Polyangiaceae bacterium]